MLRFSLLIIGSMLAGCTPPDENTKQSVVADDTAAPSQQQGEMLVSAGSFPDGFMEHCQQDDDLACLSRALLDNIEQAVATEHPDLQATTVLLELTETFLFAVGENIDHDSVAYLDLAQWETLLQNIKHPKQISLLPLVRSLQQRQHQAPYIQLPYLLRNIAICDLNFYYSDWNTPHAFFTVNNLKPFQDGGESYAFRVKEEWLGLPVRGLIVPGTFDAYGIVFDAPMDKVQQVLKQHLHGDFTLPNEKFVTSKPALGTASAFSELPTLYCTREDYEAGI